jgi:hypothetical protein
MWNTNSEKIAKEIAASEGIITSSGWHKFLYVRFLISGSFTGLRDKKSWSSLTVQGSLAGASNSFSKWLLLAETPTRLIAYKDWCSSGDLFTFFEGGFPSAYTSHDFSTDVLSIMQNKNTKDTNILHLSALNQTD